VVKEGALGGLRSSDGLVHRRGWVAVLDHQASASLAAGGAGINVLPRNTVPRRVGGAHHKLVQVRRYGRSGR
jgi:DNA-binding transcriptional LysR family regulator